MLGGPVLRQHVVEFIRGTGVVADGVVDATSLNGPWNWQVPDGVVELTLDAAAGGQSGGGGATVSAGITSAGGGAGGSNGACIAAARVVVLPRSEITIVLASGGAATSPGQRGNNGGDTTISGFVAANFDPAVAGQIRLAGAFTWSGNLPTSVSSGQGLGSGGMTGAGSSAAGADVTSSTVFGGTLIAGREGGPTPHGGAGNSNGAVAGFAGGTLVSYNTLFVRGHRLDKSASGVTDGTTSRGGGGSGAPSLFGRGGDGGSNGPGQDAPSYASGGGGGCGGYGGGKGGDGYVRFTYWSAD